MTDLSALAEAAKAAKPFGHEHRLFAGAATPDAILALYAELDEAREQINGFRLSQSLDKDSAYVIRELLDRHNVPAAAFIDDHVANAIAQRDAAEASLSEKEREVERLKKAASLAEWARGSTPTMQEPAPDSLLDDARMAALDGMEAYAAHFRSLTREQQARLVDSGEHEKNKRAAARADAPATVEDDR